MTALRSWSILGEVVDLDSMLFKTTLLLIGVAAIWLLFLFAEGSDDDHARKALTFSDLGRFGQLSLSDKLLALLLVTLILSFTAGALAFPTFILTD